jgi:hypothetical protein
MYLRVEGVKSKLVIGQSAGQLVNCVPEPGDEFLKHMWMYRRKIQSRYVYVSTTL